MQAEFRKLPAVDALLREPQIDALVRRHGQATITSLLRGLLDRQRQAIRAGNPAPEPHSWPQQVEDAVQQWAAASLLPVINATGVIIHTNLGRAPLSRAARQAVDAVASGYSNLEYDLDGGMRGSRYVHAGQRLCRTTGAEDALIVNNNAAALFLVLAALCAPGEVIISRGQLVEIGGGFRIPDVLRQSGAQLVEVGTTNRTHRRDFEQAIGPQTSAILRVHSSNFKQIGFVAEPGLAELAEVVRVARGEWTENTVEAGPQGGPGGDSRRLGNADLLLIDDLGSGTLLDTVPFGLAAEPSVQESIEAGVDVVTFSGDKLLGGPQAGIILGGKKWIERLRRHPLARALRVDKLTLAAMEATLTAYEQERALDEIPVWQMIGADVAGLRVRAEQWRAALPPGWAAKAQVWEMESAVGGGSLPGATLPSVGLALLLDGPEQWAQHLRRGNPPVVARIQHDALLLDARTVLPDQDDALIAALCQAATWEQAASEQAASESDPFWAADSGERP